MRMSWWLQLQIFKTSGMLTCRILTLFEIGRYHCFPLTRVTVVAVSIKDIPRILSYGRLFTRFLYRDIFVIFFFYAAPLLFQVDAVKEQVKAKCSVFDL